MMRSLTLALILSAGTANAELVEKNIDYKIGGQNFRGFLVYDSAGKNQPGVLVVHDWMGLAEKTKEKTREVARLGYVAFAADIYGVDQQPKSVDEAKAQSSKYKTDRKLFRERLKHALEQLKKAQNVDRKKLAAIGFCFGGTGVIELARSGADIAAVVSFHGSLDSPEPQIGKNIRAKVLALHGADDPFVTKEDLAAFEEEMRRHKIDWQLVKYGGAVHSFTDKTAGNDNSKGAAYNEKAHKRSWQNMQDFFSEVF